jgi:choline kinase
VAKAIILSAGQGRRLFPMTAETPKCLLPIQGKALIEWQLDALEACGVEQVTVVTGFGAAQVEDLLAKREGAANTTTCFNPFFEVADNLISCWVARDAMDEDFILLNGDTLFQPAVLERVMASPPWPVTLATDQKASYDADDMKISLSGQRLRRVGKELPPGQADAESIGLMVFRGEGVNSFRVALECAVRDPRALKQWYLSIIGQMASSGDVWTQSIAGLDWSEVDYPLDLLRASAMVGRWQSAEQAEDMTLAG